MNTSVTSFEQCSTEEDSTRTTKKNHNAGASGCGQSTRIIGSAEEEHIETYRSEKKNLHNTVGSLFIIISRVNYRRQQRERGKSIRQLFNNKHTINADSTDNKSGSCLKQ
ncbi:hypothetical protein KIN20_025586 [Parelaphostrongylus tenuis]|uniref:Uncharacterized protein n=1 Tax=Parelaphostrongylus tenuis TaxID=148309 RepID=A0AAD5QXT1_PARTN|nr:hypothetical protein KIN20_025586 [Parelaphostrongylus tenuis]